MKVTFINDLLKRKKQKQKKDKDKGNENFIILEAYNFLELIALINIFKDASTRRSLFCD
ncbi:hypothetical protein NSS71_11200 [Niallia sp. FSL W8-0951]|uniref:hypothetical protein n=1 Tax=Niallia sp. FSL W8-0951 TaxID=2954639 RepID=UPI0030F9C247